MARTQTSVNENSCSTTKNSTSLPEKQSVFKDESSFAVKSKNHVQEKLEISQMKSQPQIVREPFNPGDFLLIKLQILIILKTNIL